METKTNSKTASGKPDISLVRGGPFHRLQQKTGLIRAEHSDIVRRVLFTAVIGWLPMVLITAVFNRGQLTQLLRDYPIYARMLLAVPVLILGESLMESRFRMVIAHIYDAQLLEQKDLSRMEEILANMIKVRDSYLPELMMLAFVIIAIATGYKSVMQLDPLLSYMSPSGIRLTPAGICFGFISAPIFQFLVLLNLWKWLLWTVFAFRLSRLNLRVIPSHPDQNGGLAFLGMTPVAFTPIGFAATIVIGAVWRDQILHDGARLVDFRMPAIALAVIIALFALGPLFFFVPRLVALRRNGTLEYAIVGHMQSGAFHQKWIGHGAEHEEEIIAAPEISTLCDFNSAFKNVEEMIPFPTDKTALFGLALGFVIPALPTVLAEIPISVILRDLLAALK